MSTTRDEVRAAIMDVMQAAEDQGLDKDDAARQAFPGLQDMILAECRVLLRQRQRNAWWAAVERTIDGDVIRRAIGKAGGAS